MNPELIVTGTIGIDTIETPTSSVEGVLGGSAAYFAAAASFYCPVGIVATVGGDWPIEHKTQLDSFSNICVKGIEKRDSGKTFSWGGRYGVNPNDRTTLYTELGVLEENPPNIPDEYKKIKNIFLANSHPLVQMDFLKSFSNVDFVVMDTMNLWIDIARKELEVLIQKVNGIVLNDEEAEMLTGEKHPVLSGKSILKMGPEFVIVKKGEHGAVLIHEDGLGVVPAYPLSGKQVLDPTGAGDSFAGGLFGSLVLKKSRSLESIRSAMLDGTSLASHIVQGFSFSGINNKNLKDIEKRKDIFKKMMGI